MNLRKALIAVATAITVAPAAFATDAGGNPQTRNAQFAGADGPMFPSLSAPHGTALSRAQVAAEVKSGQEELRGTVVAADGSEDMTAEAAVGRSGKSRAEVRAEAVEANRTRVAGTATTPY